MNRLPSQPRVSGDNLARLTRFTGLVRKSPPRELPQLIRDELKVDITARYAGLRIAHPFGKASGQLSTTLNQVEADIEAGIAFVVLKTVIAEDESGSRSMDAWTLRETRMKVEHRVSTAGDSGWTVTWKGRGWHGTFAEYLEFFERSLEAAEPSDVPVIPSVKYHLPVGDEPFRVGEYRHTTEALLGVWDRFGRGGRMILEKDFSPTLAGDDRARQRETILRWLREVPAQIENAGPGQVTLGVKLMNALFDDAFQVEMTKTAARARPAFLVAFNRLFDPDTKVAYGGYDLSDRNLRVLEAVEGTPGLPPISATGNICSGRLMVEYARRGAENGQLHTFFQLPVSEYVSTGAGRTGRALHTLLLHPVEGLVVWLWHLAAAGELGERDGVIHFLDLAASK